MKKTLIFLLLNIFYFQFLISYNQPHLTALLDQYKKNISIQNTSYGKTIHKGINSFQQLAKNAKTHIILNQSSIKNLFTLAPEKSYDVTFNQNLKHLQEIMLIFLYAKIFNEYIKQIEIFAQDLSDSLHHWEQERFYDNLSTMRKHPTYWYHSPAYKKLVKNHVQALKEIEHEICELLGIALHGLYTLNKIKEKDNFSIKLQESILPLYKHFNISPDFEEFDALQLLQNATELNFYIQNQLTISQKKLNKHTKPSYFIRHGFFYSCAALALMAGYAIYKQNEEKIPKYKEQSIETWQYFLQEYVKAPLHKFKEIIWDKKTLEIQPLEPLEPWPNIENSGLTWWGTANPALWYNKWNSVNNQNKKNLVDCINKNIEKLGQVSKDQQLTMACAAIFPTAIIAWLGYYTVKQTYNKYVKHETWYKPMQLLIRDMDKILNRLTSTPEPSYCDDGALHLLTLRLKSFITCLNNEELFLMQQDLAEIGAYHLSYRQKRGVLERMYKTYDFLK